MADGSEPALRVDQRLVGDGGVLPEGAPDDREAPRFGDAEAHQGELGIGAPDDHRGPGAQPGHRGRDRRHLADHGARVDDRRQHAAIEPANLENSIRPFAPREVEHRRA